MSRPSWLPALFSAIDRMDTAEFSSFLTDDVSFRFGSQPAVTGKDNVREAVSGFYDSISALSHTLQKTWQGEDSLVGEGEVTYTRKDGSTITLPFANTFRLAGEKIADYRIYIDIAPLFSQ